MFVTFFAQFLVPSKDTMSGIAIPWLHTILLAKCQHPICGSSFVFLGAVCMCLPSFGGLPTSAPNMRAMKQHPRALSEEVGHRNLWEQILLLHEMEGEELQLRLPSHPVFHGNEEANALAAPTALCVCIDVCIGQLCPAIHEQLLECHNDFGRS